MDGSDRLSALRTALVERLGAERFELWLGAHAALSLAGEVLTVRCPSEAELKFVRRRLDAVLAEICTHLWGTALPIVYEAATHDRQRRLFDHAGHTSVQAEPSLRAAERPATKVVPEITVDPRSLFEDFHIGPSNALAVHAAEQAAAEPGRYSPLVFAGPSGCGKSHLLRAIVHRVRRVRRRVKVLALSAEQFTTQFLDALHRRDLPGFRHKTRSADLLLIDDVQFLLSKKATLGELLYTIDAIHGRGGQVVLGADRSAAEIQAASPELASRLSSGLVATIDPPECAVRRGILRSLAALRSMELSDEVIELVAQQVVGSGRLLSGALNHLAAASMAEGKTIDRDFAASELEGFCRRNSPQVRLIDVQRAVCEAFSVEPATLKSARKDRAIAEPRMLAMWLARRYTRAALSEIGDFFGRRSHSTVVSAQKKLDALIGSGGDIRLGGGACRVEDALRRIDAILRTG